MEIDENSDDYKRGKEIYNEISRQLNNSIGNRNFNAGFFNALVSDHRTLQQAYGRFTIALLIKYGKLDKNMFSDLRNEAFLKFCKDASVLLEEAHLPFI